MAAALAREGAAAAAPGVLVRAAARAAVLVATGKNLVGVVSVETTLLLEGVLKTMFLTKLKVGTVVILGAALLGGGGGVLTYRTVAGEQPAAPNAPVAAAQDARPVASEVEKLRGLLLEKEKEVRDLRDRLSALEKEAREQLRARADLELVYKRAQDWAAREQELAKMAQGVATEGERRNAPDAKGGSGVRNPFGHAPTAAERAAQVEEASAEIELLAAQLETKRAQLKAASLSLAVAQRGAQGADRNDPKAQMEVATQQGLVEIRSAEVRESEIRLVQAKRRLTRLQGKAEPPPQEARRPELGQRAAELEQKLDALYKEVQSLRKEIQNSMPRRP